MKAALVDKYDLRVPRYTSYPTAPHFSEAVGDAEYRTWLSQLSPDVPLSLYSHIPFCDEMCWFCGCYTKIVKRYEPVAEYLSTVLDEIDLVAGALPGRFPVKHLHWGGGSPTMLKGEDWKHIIGRFKDRFDVLPDAEVAVELDPRTATEDYVRTLAEAGVNRASIGVQDFDEKVQKAINRIQPFDVTERVVGWLRKYGINSINMDLMYGLPHQTTELVVREVDLAVGMNPRRIALFGYAHVPWMKSHQKMIRDEDLPDTQARWEQFEAATNRLIEHGFVAIGLDHFAKPDDDLAIAFREGRMHRNFQGYTTDTATAMIGFGASSIGHLPQGFVQNHAPLKAHREAVAAGRLPIARGIAFSDEDKLRSDVIERLMCDMKVDIAAICAKHGVGADHFAAEWDKLKPLADDGLVALDGSKITVLADGRPLIRLVAAAFDAYLDPSQGRHSKAV